MTMPGGGGDRQANVTVTANVDPYVKSVNAANAATLKFADALQKVDQQVLKIAKIAGAGAMAAGGAGLLKAFGDVKTAAALEESFKSLAAQSTVTGTNVGKVTTEVIKLGTQIPIATQSLAAMSTQIAALGVQGVNNLKNITKQAEQLAAATNTAPGQLMTGLLQLNQSLGGSLEDLGRYGSALTTLQAKMGVASTDVLGFMKGIEAVGAKAGVTEAQMMGMSAAFVKVGADGFAGAQAFNSIVNDMADAVSRNSPRLMQYANLLGMTGDQFKSLVSSGNSAQAFIDFINAVSNSGARASQVLEEFGLDGVRTQRVFAALTSGQANLAGAISETNAAFRENSSMADASAAAWEGFDSQLQRIQNAATQLKNELGAPLLAPLTALSAGIADVSASFGNFVRFVDDAPWPIGDTLTSLVTKTPALLLLGGAFLTVTAALTKFTGAWRMMTGAIGINAFRGFLDGRNGNAPRDLGNTGRLGSMLYRRTYAMAGGTPEVGGIIGNNAKPGIGSMIAGYPLMRFRQQMGGALDTMFHPFSPEKRDSGKEIIGGIKQKVDPFSMQGMFQQGKAGAAKYRAKWIDHLKGQVANETDEAGNISAAGQRAQTMMGVLERGLGPMEESKEFLERRRFNYVNTARTAAVEQQQSLIAKMSNPQLVNAMRQAELGEYIQKNGTNEGFEGTKWENFGHRSLIKRANDSKHGLAAYAGATAAATAGSEFDASLGDDETNKLANPFSKLADKVKSITKELATSTGAAMETVISAVTAAYQKGVDLIIELARKAKQSIVEIQAYAENPAGNFDAAMSKIHAEYQAGKEAILNGSAAQSAGDAAGGVTEKFKEVADQLKEAIGGGEESSGGSSSGHHAPGTIIAGGTQRAAGAALRDPRELGRGAALGFTEATAGAREAELLALGAGGVASTRISGQRVQNLAGSATGRLGSRIAAGARATGSVARSVGGGILQAGKALGGLATSLLSPQVLIAATLFGPALYRMVEGLISGHQKLTQQTDMAGAAIQQALGRQVVSQADIVKQQQQKANSGNAQNAFGQVEQKNAKAGTFQDNYKDQIDVLQLLGADKGKGGTLDKDKLSDSKSWLQDYVNGMIAQQNGGKPLDDQQKQQIREMLLASTGSAAVARQIYSGIDFTGATGSSFLPSVGAQYAKDPTDLLRDQLSKTIIGNYNANTNGGIAGLFAALGADTAGNTYNPGSHNAANSGGRGAQNGGANTHWAIGDDASKDLISQFVSDYNDSHKDGKIDLSKSGIKGDPNSAVGVFDQIRLAAKNGDKGAKDVWNQLKDVLGTNDFNGQGELKQSAIDRLNGLVTGGLGQASASGNLGSRIGDSWVNQAYRRATGDKDGYVTSLLGNPDAKDYGRNIDRTMGQLTNGATIFGGAEGIQNMKNAAVALQTLKDAIGTPSDPAWQQLDKLQQQTFQNIASAAQLGGGQAFQLNTQSSLVGLMLQGGVTDENHDDIQKQNDALTQQAAGAVQQLNQYWTQVRDAHIQQKRGAEDHHTQMVRMERDYNKQMGEAQYGFAKQQEQATYSYNEQLRQMKYTMANAFGNPAQFVQSQFTMGAQSAEIGMKRQLDLLKRQQTAMKTLAGQGLSQDTIRLFGLDDPKNVQQAEKFVKDFAKNPQLVQTFNSEISDRLNIADAIAQDPNNTQFSELQRQFQHTADVAADAFAHSQTLSSQQFQQTMDDFEADYKTSTKRASEDLSRLAEDTTKSWQDVVAWAQNSGIPGVESLATAAVGAINQVNTATGQLQQALSTVTTGFATTLSQLGADWQNFVAQNPQFAAANGIDMGGSGTPGATAEGLSGVKAQVNRVAANFGWGTGLEWNDLEKLINSESSFNPNAANPHSSARGLFQKMTSVHGPIESTVEGQTNWGLNYIKQRYGDPVAAWNFHLKNGWYANGGVFDKAQVIGVGEGGPETVLPLNSTGASFVAKTLRASLQMMGANPNLASEVRRGQMQQFGSPARSEMHIHHTDASTNFTGDITVVAQDPNQMARSLQERKRLQALTRPVGRR